MKTVIIFDMDGVLFDTIPFARDFFIEQHTNVTESMYNNLHKGNFHTEAAKLSHLKKPLPEEESLLRREIYSQQKSFSSLFPGIKNLLEELYAKEYILGINTNAYERNCLSLLEKQDIKNLYSTILTADISKDKQYKFNKRKVQRTQDYFYYRCFRRYF